MNAFLMRTRIAMSNVPGEPDSRELLYPLAYERYDGEQDFISAGFTWDGSSIPIHLLFVVMLILPMLGSFLPGWVGFWTLFVIAWVVCFFPKHRHPVASCRHDKRCADAKNSTERAWADWMFFCDVRTTSWLITALIGYAGVRIGAVAGIGVHYPHFINDRILSPLKEILP